MEINYQQITGPVRGERAYRAKLCHSLSLKTEFVSFFSLSVVSAWLEDSVSPIINSISQRIQAITGLSIEWPHAEPLQVRFLGGLYEYPWGTRMVTFEINLGIRSNIILQRIKRLSPR